MLEYRSFKEIIDHPGLRIDPRTTSASHEAGPTAGDSFRVSRKLNPEQTN